MTTCSIGNQTEGVVVKFFQDLGFKILERSFTIRVGEVDIARNSEELVSVEVKARFSHKFGEPLKSITHWMVQSLLKTARPYIQNIKWGEKFYWIDALSINYTDTRENSKIELIKNIIQ